MLLALLAAVGGVVCLSVCVVTTIGSPVQHAQVYTIGSLRVKLAVDPAAWQRQIVRVHAIPARQWCFDWALPANGTCKLWEPALLGDERGNMGEPLPLAWGSPPPRLAVLRRMPLLALLAPSPQAIDWATPGVYTIQLERASCFSGGTGPCYEAVILDAAAA
jgi:hypothetical protein